MHLGSQEPGRQKQVPGDIKSKVLTTLLKNKVLSHYILTNVILKSLSFVSLKVEGKKNT
jgi:hypothetical protein